MTLLSDVPVVDRENHVLVAGISRLAPLSFYI